LWLLGLRAVLRVVGWIKLRFCWETVVELRPKGIVNLDQISVSRSTNWLGVVGAGLGTAVGGEVKAMTISSDIAGCTKE